MKEPKYYNTIFCNNVRKAYNNKKLTLSNIDEWETAYNGGIKPEPSLGTREILDYYINVIVKDRQAKQRTLWSNLSSADQTAIERAIDYAKYDLNIDIEDINTLEDIAREGCRQANEGNAEPEFEDEDFYEDEANYNAVLEYLKYEYGLDE